MPNNDKYQPKQQRSQNTQQKLIKALHFCLQDKFFEHISIKELAEHAGVSVGTFYRRFKDKESLLPLLYQDFGNDLNLWVESIEQGQYESLSDIVNCLCHEMLVFLTPRKSIFRTLHLNSRLHSAILSSDKTVDRRVIYQRLRNVLLRFEGQITVKDKAKSVDLVVFLLINSLLDKILYPDLTPAIACDLNAEEFTLELAAVLKAYLYS